MSRPIRWLCRLRERSERHFTVLRDAVTQDNLRALRRAVVAFEVFLLLYGVWASVFFHNRMLTGIYLSFLLLNGPLLWYAFSGRNGVHTFHRVQAGCTVLVAVVLSFVICVSVFPLPDDPAIFYPLGYVLMIVLFQFPFWYSVLLFSGITGLFLALAFWYKTPECFALDVAGAVTAWILGFIILYVVTDLNLRTGEIRMELERRSRTDFLTGLPNRRELDAVFGRVYRRCAGMGLPVAAVMLDVDHFKQYNDEYGHAAGDKCLTELGRRLAEFTEETGFFAARFGGEEFVVLFSDCDEERVAAYVRNLLEKLRFQIEGGRPITVSLGAAVENARRGGSHEALLRRADEALYRAKETGRDRYVLDGRENAGSVK